MGIKHKVCINIPSVEIFTVELHGTTGVNIPSYGAATPGWNMVQEPAMPIPFKSLNFKTLRSEP